MKDTIEVTSVVDGDPFRLKFKEPEHSFERRSLNIRLMDTPEEQEKRLFNEKKIAAEEFARVNRIDKIGFPKINSKIGLIAAGKNWLDLIHAFSLLGIDAHDAEELGITSYKIVQTWPIDRQSLLEWSDQLDLIIVVEEKRKIIETQVKDSRPAEDHVSIRRRRSCPACGGRFTTYERVQLRDLVVVKKNGKRENFDRDKLDRSVRVALQKRPISPERIDQMITGTVRRLESLGDTEVNSEKIGKIIMETLARIDNVAYVRFASVYKNFQTTDDFEEFVAELRPPLSSSDE